MYPLSRAPSANRAGYYPSHSPLAGPRFDRQHDAEGRAFAQSFLVTAHPDFHLFRALDSSDASQAVKS